MWMKKQLEKEMNDPYFMSQVMKCMILSLIKKVCINKMSRYKKN